MKVILDLSSATANAAVVVTKGAWQYIERKCMCTNRCGTYKAHSNHQLCHNNRIHKTVQITVMITIKVVASIHFFGQGNYSTKNLCAMCIGTKADFSQCNSH